MAAAETITAQHNRKFTHRNAITVVEKYYFRSGDEQPYSVDHRYIKPVLNGEDNIQVYHRRTSAKEAEGFNPIGSGWFDPKDIGLMIIINGAGSFPQKVPTDGEREEEAKKVLQIGTDFGIPICEIHPGESLKMQPTNLDHLRIRSLHGTVKFTVYLFPK